MNDAYLPLPFLLLIIVLWLIEKFSSRKPALEGV